MKRWPPATDPGFTLVEVLVSLVGASLLAGALATMVVSQSGFQARHGIEVSARENIRAAVDLMGGELRGASAGDVLVAEPESVVVRFDVTRALVCDTLAGGAALLFVYDSVAAPNVSRGFRGTAVSQPYTVPFRYADGFTPTTTRSARARTTCRANGADAAGQAPPQRFRESSGWGAAFGRTPPPGSLVRTYGALSYALEASRTHAGAVAIWRNQQEFATPFASGARFRYAMSDGTVLDRVSAENTRNIRGITIVATASGAIASDVRRALVYDVPLRN